MLLINPAVVPFLLLLLLALFPGPAGAFASVPARKPALPAVSEAAAHQAFHTAEENYLRGLALVEGAAPAGVRDYRAAAAFYRQAALQGHAQAQNNLGVLYAKGLGVPRSDTEAAAWYRRAADQGHLRAMTNLASLYLEGRGVKRDHGRAFRLFSQAAEAGHAPAQNNLALMYANGQSVKTNYVWAYAWLELASGQLASSAALRDRLALAMSPRQLADAKERAREKKQELAARAP